MPLTEGTQIDEHRQAAEIKLANRKLGIMLNNYAPTSGLSTSNISDVGRDCHDEWENGRGAIEPIPALAQIDLSLNAPGRPLRRSAAG